MMVVVVAAVVAASHGYDAGTGGGLFNLAAATGHHQQLFQHYQHPQTHACHGHHQHSNRCHQGPDSWSWGG